MKIKLIKCQFRLSAGWLTAGWTVTCIWWHRYINFLNLGEILKHSLYSIKPPSWPCLGPPASMVWMQWQGPCTNIGLTPQLPSHKAAGNSTMRFMSTINLNARFEQIFKGTTCEWWDQTDSYRSVHSAIWSPTKSAAMAASRNSGGPGERSVISAANWGGAAQALCK